MYVLKLWEFARLFAAVARVNRGFFFFLPNNLG